MSAHIYIYTHLYLVRISSGPILWKLDGSFSELFGDASRHASNIFKQGSISIGPEVKTKL